MPLTCADGARPKTRSGSRRSRWSPPTSPRATGAASPEHLDHTVRVADPFHVVRVANRWSTRCAAGSRTRRSGTGGARPTRSIGSASSCSPAPSASTSAATSACCSGCAGAIPTTSCSGAWLAKESVRDVYLTEKVGEARTLLKKAIVGCQSDEVAEIRSLGDTLERWQTRDLEPSPHRSLQRPRPRG